MAEILQITGDAIRLGQLLKLANLGDTGADAKILLAGGEVLVNGEPETRRGRQLHGGDIVRYQQREFQIATGER